MRKFLHMLVGIALVAAAPLAAQDSPAALIIRVQGDVQIRQGGGAPGPATAGVRLSAGDEVLPGTGARATLIVPSGATQQITEATTVTAPPGGMTGDLFQRAMQEGRRLSAEHEHRRLLSRMQDASVDDVVRWLVERVELPQYEQAFRDNKVDGPMLIDVVANARLEHLVEHPLQQIQIRSHARPPALVRVKGGIASRPTTQLQCTRKRASRRARPAERSGALGMEDWIALGELAALSARREDRERRRRRVRRPWARRDARCPRAS